MINHTTSIPTRMKYYVYQLRASNSEVPFYVGKGQGKRAISHLAKARCGNAEFPQYDSIREYWNNNVEVLVEYLFCTNDENTALQVEADCIQMYRKHLVNLEHHTPNLIKHAGLTYPRLESHAPFPFQYVLRGRHKYRLESIHEHRANKIAQQLHVDPVKCITDDFVQFYHEIITEA